MSKIKDYISKHKKSLRNIILVGGVSLSVGSVALYKTHKTNIHQSGTTFIVSNKDIGRGYVFIYNAEESGWEYLYEERGEYDIFVETSKVDDEIKETKTRIRLNNLGKKHPLSNKMMYPDYFLDNDMHGVRGRINIGEEILDKTRRKYQDHIPFQRILDKIKD